MNIITANHLVKLLENEVITLVDARGGLDARARFEAGHLKGALFADLETDLSQKDENPANGGRHPLPSPQAFGTFLGGLGISPTTTVIVYDDKKGANAAARFWWMLKAAGHEKVSVLSGGLDAAQEAGLEIVQGAPAPVAPASYPVTEWTLPTVTMDFVSNTATDPNYTVIDVREHYRYVGESEPIDLVAGHIPGAVNIPYTSNLDENGNFLSPEALKMKYQEALGDKEPSNVIVHCGSGVTACHTLLALSEAGFDGAALYVGSWSEWSRNDNPIAVGSH